MAVLARETREFLLSCRFTDPGNFVTPRSTEWIACREVVQYRYRLDDPGFWFSYSLDELEGIVAFITWVERTLHLPDSRFISNQAKQRFVWVEPAPFWRSDEMRKNVFTMLLRNARLYAAQVGTRSVLRAFQDYAYSRETLPALERFFMGFTTYTGPPLVPAAGDTYVKVGWYSQFANKSSQYIRDNLKNAD